MAMAAFFPTFRKFMLGTAVVVSVAAIVPAARAAEAVHVPKQSWSFDGVFGTYDKMALQRGYKIYREVCAACHSMDRVAFRNLADLGYSPAQIKAVAAEYSYMDAPNDEGEILERKGLPSDPFKNPYANREQAMYINGAFPPDLSLIVKARAGGADYIYALLTGYEHAHEGVTLGANQHYNKYFPGHILMMPPPLADGQVSFDDDAPQTLDQYARDVATFLAWASEPHMEERKRTGLMAFIFLLVFTGVMYTLKKKIWSKVH